MARTYRDEQYYARFFNNMWLIGTTYMNGDIVNLSETFYQANGNPPVGDSPANQTVNPSDPNNRPYWIVVEVPQALGENRFITLEDTINNYIVLYNDEADHGGKMSRTKIEALAKRAVQEFSYDTFQVKEEEFELGDSAKYPLPQDFVELVDVLHLDANGFQRPIPYRKDSTFSTNYLQGVTTADGSNIEYDYNDDGSRMSMDSESNNRYNSNNPYRARTANQGGGDIRATGIGYYVYGKRYYLETEHVNSNGSYVINGLDGTIELEPTLMGEVIVLRYISDGLSSDPSQIRYHKFAEDAIYNYIYYHSIVRKATIPANEKQRAQRAMYASKRTAKLRLSPISPTELLQTLRGQARWIKT